MYDRASGPSFDDCYYLGRRYESDRGWHPDDCEWWVMFNRPGPANATTVGIQYGTTRWFPDIWRSPAGVAYVADMEGEVHINPDLTAPDSPLRWTVHKFPVVIIGVWGLDDTCVFAWGSTHNQGCRVYRWDGATWHELPRPMFEVLSLHGVAPDLIYAGGTVGDPMARWNGRDWDFYPIPAHENITSVHVVSADEVYATGHHGSLLRGSASGWSTIAQRPPVLHAVAKWHDDLWIAGGQAGLLRLVPSTFDLEVVKPNLRATAFDARQDLVITCDGVIFGTTDGASFSGTARGFLAGRRGDRALGDID
jgi:hypothetical protein